MGRGLSGIATLAAVVMVVAAPPGMAAEPDPAPAATPEPGSYVMLLDRSGAIQVLQYRIGDGALIAFRQPPVLLAPDINTVLVVDRGFLPTRIVDAYRFAGYQIDYGDLPDPSEEGRAPLLAAVYRSGFTQPPALLERYVADLVWLGSETRAYSAGTFVGYTYETDFHVGIDDVAAPRTRETVARRVYVPALDLDLDAGTWAAAADIRVGRVTSSAELGPITWLMSDIPAEMRDCIADVVALPEYLPHSAAIGALERRTLGLIDRARTDLLEFGIEDYEAVAKRYGIAEKFRGCVPM